MPIDLTRPADQVSIDDAAYQPLFKQLQGNILKPHGRNVEKHIFLKFTGPAASVRAWIRNKLSARILTTADQYDQSRTRAEAEAAGGEFDGGMVTLFFLSAAGYRYLGFNPANFDSGAFKNGMKDQSDSIRDFLFSTGNKDPKPNRWEAGYRDTVHALVQLADDPEDETRLLNGVELIKSEVAGFATVLAIETGRALRRTVDDGVNPKRVEPIEHFGYFDGISQPLFTAEDLKNYYERDKKGTDAPGNWRPGASLDLVLADDPFNADSETFGSYLVYRKLYQNFGEFERRVEACAQAVGISEDMAGAQAVGRFKDGTPLAEDDHATADYKNDFVYKRDDPDGWRCPAFAHARKVNPRATTPHTSPEAERRRRIARRAIPYGKPMPEVCDAEDTDPNDAAERGLLFMCFQANVERQFEFIQRTWVDNPNFPDNVFNLPGGTDTGDDPLIGQDPREKQRWPKKWDDAAAGRKSFNFEAAVTLKGGEYFFAPSKAFLEGL